MTIISVLGTAATIAAKKNAPIPAPPLNVTYKALRMITRLHRVRSTPTIADIIPAILLGIAAMNETALLIINMKFEYPYALKTCIKESASPPILLPM